MKKLAYFLLRKLTRAWRWSRKRLVRYPKYLWEFGFTRQSYLNRHKKLGQIPSLSLFPLPAAPTLSLRATDFQGRIERSVRMSAPQLYIRRIENIIFEPNQDFLVRDGHVYLQTLGISRAASDPKEGHSLFSAISSWNNSNLSLVNTAPLAEAVDLPEGVLLNGSFPQNWYHWTVCILPKAFVYATYYQGQFEAPFLVSETVKETPMDALLRILLPEATIKYLPNRPYRVNHAVVVDSPVREVAYSRRRGGAIDWTSMGSFHAGLMKEFRDALLSIAEDSRDSTSTTPERVYLARRGVSRPYNDSETWDSLRARGFERVFVEDLTPIEQINLFANGKYFVSTTGAQWVGIMFATNARGLLIAPRFLMPSTLFQKLAYLGGSTISAFELQTADSNWNQHFMSTSRSHVRQELLIASVNQMLEQGNG